MLVVSTDKGLAGALNTNLMREAMTFDAAKTVYVSAGRKARQFIVRGRRELLASFELKDAPTIVETKLIARFCLEKFLTGEVDKVTVLYTHFINTISQKALAQTLLPISQFPPPSAAKSGTAEEQSADPLLGYIFEPSAEAVLDFMLPYYVQYQVYQMILDARASEHSARNGGDEKCDRQRQSIHQGSHPRVQQDAPGEHHHRTARDFHRANGARRLGPTASGQARAAFRSPFEHPRTRSLAPVRGARTSVRDSSASQQLGKSDCDHEPNDREENADFRDWGQRLRGRNGLRYNRALMIASWRLD